MHALLHSVPLTLQQATADPRLCQILPDTHRQVGVSLCGFTAPFSWVLVHTRFIYESSKSLFPQSCVSSGSFMVGLMATSSKRAYATPRSEAPSHTQVCCTLSSCPCSSPLLPLTSTGDIQTRSASVSLGSLGPGAHKVCLSPFSISDRYWV